MIVYTSFVLMATSLLASLSPAFALNIDRPMLSYHNLTGEQSKVEARSTARRAECPSELVRRASLGLHPDEIAYVAARKPIVQHRLAQWISNVDANFTVNTSNLPTLALATSGGGFRATFTGAGVHQAFDEDETDVQSGLKGLYQAMLYESALSGGGWFLGSLAHAGWPTVSELSQSLWVKTVVPGLLETLSSIKTDVKIVGSLLKKLQQGLAPTMVDVYGHMLGYTLLSKESGSEGLTMSALMAHESFKTHRVPFPIITAIEGAALQQCMPELGATQFEVTPVTFGSWDSERAAFIPTQFIGSTTGTEGKVQCMTGIDNLGYLLAMSSDVFPVLCQSESRSDFQSIQRMANFTQSLLGRINLRPAARAVYAALPNFFVPQRISNRMRSSELYLLDGGGAGQGNPIWPHLHRQVDVLFANDNSGELNGYTDGTALRNTYLQAQIRGLTRMPFVPDNNTFVRRGYNARPTFFGCDDRDAQGRPTMIIIFLPNAHYVFPSNTDTYKLAYTLAELHGMLLNGQAVATYNGKQGFATCVACAIMKNTGAQLPATCAECFEEYCAVP